MSDVLDALMATEDYLNDDGGADEKNWDELMKKRLIKLWCFFRGHDWLSVVSDNGRSVLVRHECARCEAYRDMQFDYGI